MSLITLDNIFLSYSAAPLFDMACLSVEDRERVAVVGRNGAGKSTLLRILDGSIKTDDGRRIVRQGLRISRLEQDPPAHLRLPVYCYAVSGVPGVGEALAEYYKLLKNPDNQQSRLSELGEIIEAGHGWPHDTEVRRILSLMRLDPDAEMATLSGGWLRKVALARALAASPDLLLLDEPTNHVDIPAILWLQEFIRDFHGAVVFISHDRSFINAVATRVIDVDRGRISSFPGNFDSYLEAKKEALRLEELRNQDFDRRLSIEEAWIRKGIKARLTRSDSRVRRLKEMRREHQERRKRLGNVHLRIDSGELSGKIVFEITGLGLRIGERELVRDFSAYVVRGDRIGIVGANGTGKTTLINALLGNLKPERGTIRTGSRLEVAFFDQYREQLDPEKTVMDNLAPGKTEVEVAGKKQHVCSYLQDFLFSAERARTPVKALSGGEKNRLLLARIFLRPCNLLILDEPTNDLDIETLDLLEDLLENYGATLIVVSHDRYFLDRVVTDTWFFDGTGNVESFIGGYSDAMAVLAAREQEKNTGEARENSATIRGGASQNSIVREEKQKNRPRRLSFKESRELEALPLRIEELETEIAELEMLFGSSGYAALTPDDMKKYQEKYASCQSELEKSYARWEELESIANP